MYLVIDLDFLQVIAEFKDLDEAWQYAREQSTSYRDEDNYIVVYY